MRGTLLMAAVATQQLELIELLLSAGASVHVTDAFGCTALSSASCPLDHQPNRAKLARGALPTASRQVRAPHPDPHPTPTRPQPDPNPTLTLPLGFATRGPLSRAHPAGGGAAAPTVTLT